MCEDICVTVNQTVENILVEVREFSINNVISSDAGNSATTGSDGLLFVPASSSGGVTKTSDLTNDGSDGTSTYVEVDELGAVATSNDYNDLDNLPTIPTVITNHSELTLDDGTNPHNTTKADVGLGNVDNTSDLDKPISTAAQTALDLNVKKSEAQSFTYPSITGADAVIPLPANGASIIIVKNASLISIAGFDLSLITGNPNAEIPYLNKEYTLENQTNNNVTLKHLSSVAIGFFALDETDLIIPPGKSVRFNYGYSLVKETFKNWSESGAGEAIDSTGNTILFDNVIGTFYNEDTPLTGDLTFSETGAKKGGKAVVYHSEDIEPSIILPATKKIITKKGDYQYNAFGNVYVNRIEALRTPNGNFDLMLQSDFYLPTFDEDVQGVIDLAITNGDTLPSTSALIKVNDTVIALKNEGVWNLCDAVFLFATELREFSKYDIKRKIKATEINPPLIYTSTGFKGQLASTKCLNIGFNPISSGVNYTLNNAGVYIYANGQTGTGYFFGSLDSDNTKRTLLGTNNSNTFYNSLNGNGASFAYGTFTGSHYNLSREDSVNETVIIDGVSNVVANASTGIPNANIYVLARNLAGSVSATSDVTASALLIGASLKNKDAEIRTIIDNYLA